MTLSTRRLAQIAGVSAMTASRALRGRDGISDETRRRLVRLARKHGMPIPATRALETPDLLNVVGSMIYTKEESTQPEVAFNSRLFAGLRRGSAECGSEIVSCATLDDVWPLVVNRRQVDGVVLLLGDESMPHPPFPPPVPAVCILAGPEDMDVITADNFGASRKLGIHLAELGHRRVAYIGPETELSQRRLAGLRTGLETAGGGAPPECVRTGRRAMGKSSTLALLDNLLESLRPGERGPDGFTALMAYNDYMAATAILYLRERRLRVPEDVSVVGFDAVMPPWYDGPSITTMAIPLEEIGAEAARFLYWRLTHPSAPRRRLVLSTTFVPGKTTARLVPAPAIGNGPAHAG